MWNKLIAVLFFLLLPLQSFAKETLKRFRWDGKNTNTPQMVANYQTKRTLASMVDEKADLYLKETGELVLKESQLLGDAKIHGTWKQSVLKKDGTLIYAAGEVVSNLPKLQLPLASSGASDFSPSENFIQSIPELRNASKVYPASLEVRQLKENTWQSYWRVDYLNKNEDKLSYLLLNSGGEILERGEIPWDGLDGKANVFPKGPKLSNLQEVPLRSLVGDGTLKGVELWVHSVLNLSVWSPDLLFFYPLDDKRFDLSQVYYTIEQSYSWLKDVIGIEMRQPIEVRLHIGDNGVSNAAFYHQNTIYLGTGDGVVYKDMLRDPSVVTHESIHAVIDAYVGLPSEGEGGSFNEGFSDLFTAFILDNPKVGESSYMKAPYRRTLENKLVAYKDFNSGVYQNGTIIGGTFWDMKPSLGTEATAKLAFRTLVRLGKGARFDDFAPAVISAADSFMQPEQKAIVLEALRNRGWRVE